MLGRSMQTILSALLWFVKTIKGGKGGPGRYYYFLLSNNTSIQIDAKYSTTSGKLRWLDDQEDQEVSIAYRLKNETFSEELFIYENPRRRTDFLCACYT